VSNDVRRYDPDTEWFEDADPLTVTAVSGSPRLDLREDDPEERKGHGRSVQLTIGRGMNAQFTILTEAQVLDLMAILSKRLACADNYSATAPLDEYRVQPDGTKEVVEEW
jgi:hypothetical protein